MLNALKMLFFQILLLGGYLYSHLLTSRLVPRRQVQVHLALLLASLAWLPIAPDVSWKPTAGEAPLSRILLLLAATVGAPYFVLSTTGPLMQRWFTWTSPGTSPWRLYALSNVGSLLALLHKWTMRTCFNAQEEIYLASMDEIAQVGAVHPRIGRHIGPPCVIRNGLVSPRCTEGRHFCGVPVWRDFPAVVRRL